MRDLISTYVFGSALLGVFLLLLFALGQVLVNDHQRAHGEVVSTRSPWVTATPAVVALLVVVWPCGLVAMWSSSWERRTKMVVTIAIVVAVAGGFVLSSSS